MRPSHLDDLPLWYDQCGTGDPVVLVHGAAVDSRFWKPNTDALAERFTVYTPDARGHGRTPDGPGPVTHRALAGDLAGFLTAVPRRPVHLVGHGEGAEVVLHVALRCPELVDRLVLIGCRFAPRGPRPRVDVAALERALGPSYDCPDYRAVAEKAATLAAQGPSVDAADTARLRPHTLVMSGDHPVPLEHAIALYEAVPHGELAVVPGTSFFVTQQKPLLCNRILLDFLAAE